MATDCGEQDEIGRLQEDHERHCARDLRQRGAEAAVHVEGQRTLGQLGVDNGDQVGHRPYGQELSVGKRPVEPTDQLAQHEGVQQKETQGKRPHERQERQQLRSRNRACQKAPKGMRQKMSRKITTVRTTGTPRAQAVRRRETSSSAAGSGTLGSYIGSSV